MKVIGPHPRIGHRRRGLTLVECTLAMLILALAVTAVALAVGAGQSQAFEAARRMRAAALAEAMMEEILARPHHSGDDPTLGPDTGESDRSEYNDANDYHGLQEEPGSLLDAAGNVCPSPLQGFGRSVACEVRSVSVTGWPQPIDALQVTVTVSDNDVALVALKRLIVDEAPPE